MDIETLKEFLVLCEHLNYSSAASELHISKDVLSRHIIRLESTLGITLFTRTTRTVALTAEGHAFMPYALNMVKVYDSYQKKLLESRREHLTIGSFRSIAPYGIANVISSFGMKEPDITLNIIEAFSPLQISMMQQGNSDCAFIARRSYEPPKDLADDFHIYAYYRDKYVVVLPADHRLANRTEISIAELKNERFIDIAWAQTAGSNKKPFSSGTHNVGLWVSQEHGIGILAELDALHQVKGLKNITLVPLSEPNLYSNIYFLFPKDNSNPCVYKFLEYLQGYNEDISLYSDTEASDLTETAN